MRSFAARYQPIFELARRLDEWDARASGPWRRCAAHGRERHRGRTVGVAQPVGGVGRGYSLTHRTADGQVIRAAAELFPGEQITTRFASGQAISRVDRVL